MVRSTIIDLDKTGCVLHERRALIGLIEATWALDAVAFAAVLSHQDPSWGSQTIPLGGGHLVLCGHLLYVNRALAFGIEQPVTVDDFAELETRTTQIGLEPAIEVTPTSHDSVGRIAARRGYRLHNFRTAHVRSLGDGDIGVPDPSIVIERADGSLLGTWLETTAVGWGHTTIDARRASDAFARAAAVIDQHGFLLASDATDGRPLGTASLTIRDGLATLGGMSTRPSERRRGVQQALIRHRLRLARDAGCELATASTVPGGGSERNLTRAGFRPLYDKVTLVRSSGAESPA
jgi:GNAT superfamily N-acetyltransferase